MGMVDLGQHGMVSVCVITYQHIGYIGQCLDSILMQETDFPFEIIVGEDESTDGTREICNEYARRFPEKIRLFLRSRKDVMYIQGHPTGRFNFLENLKAARGEYIAICEGDDYWMDPLKLQKQFNYLKENQNCSAVFTDLVMIDREGEYLAENRRMPLELSQLHTYHLMQGNAIHTANFFFKREIINEKTIDFIARMPYADMPLYLVCSLHGPIGHMPELMSVYRVNVGIMQNYDKAQRARNSMHIRESFIKEFGNDAQHRMQYLIGKKKYYLLLSLGNFRNGKLIAGLRAYGLFWWSTVYRIFPRYPIWEKISLGDHFRPLQEWLGFLKRRIVTRHR